MSGNIAPVPYIRPELSIILTPLPASAVGVAYSTKLGDVYYVHAKITNATWQLTDIGLLPVGSTVSASGTLSATFAAPGSYYFTVTVSASVYTGASGHTGGMQTLSTTRIITLDALASGGGTGKAINVAQATLQNAQSDVAYANLLGAASVIGESLIIPTWSLADAGTLPGGAAIGSTGILTATFSGVGTASFTAKVSAPGAADVSKHYVINVVSSGGSSGSTSPIPAPPILPPVPSSINFDTLDEVGTELKLVTHQLTDDGLGYLSPTQDSTGTVDYDTGVLYFPPEIFFVSNVWVENYIGATLWTNENISDVFANGSQITVSYRPDSVVPTTATQTLPAQNIVIDLAPYTADTIVPGTVRFSIGSTVYEDFEGVISHTVNALTGVGTPCGTIDYSSGEVILTDWVTGSSAFSLLSLATYRGQFIDTKFDFRTVSSPLKPNGFQVAATALDGELLTGSADVAGVITGDAMTGHVDVEYGRVQIQFGELVLDSSLTVDEKLEDWYDVADVDVDGYIWKPRKIIPQTGRYNTTVYSYLPLSANMLGLDPVRLPMNGRVPTCRAGDSAILHFTDTLLLADVAANSVHNLGETFLARVWIKDANQITIPGEKYTANLDTGVITFAADLSLVAYNLPLTAHFMIADEALVTDVDVSGTVMLGRSILHDFPLGSYLSTEIRIGDMGGRVTVPFAQGSWSSVWSDVLIGTTTTAKFANNLYPIVTTNDGAIQERWRIQFVTSNTVNVIGETLGQLNIAALSILEVIAPINPVTSTPYFTIPLEGWGAGWISGNLLRFNTMAADFPIDVLRCVKMGPATGQPDRIGLEFLGDVDA